MPFCTMNRLFRWVNVDIKAKRNTDMCVCVVTTYYFIHFCNIGGDIVITEL